MRPQAISRTGPISNQHALLRLVISLDFSLIADRDCPMGSLLKRCRKERPDGIWCIGLQAYWPDDDHHNASIRDVR
jgi:hypothetical protein